MTDLAEEALRAYAAMALRAEIEDYCPVEQVIALAEGASTTAEELDALVRDHLPDGSMRCGNLRVRRNVR